MDDRTLTIALIVGAYTLACLGIGVWATLRTRDSTDFFMAGRNLGPLILAFAAVSTMMSGFGFIGGPGLVYGSGTSSFWIICPAILSSIVPTVLIAKRFKIFADLFDILTLPDVVAIRYRSETCRFLAALAILLGVLAYLGTQIRAMGLAAALAFGIDEGLAIIAGMTIVILYAVFGGVIAGIYTDFIQGVIMAVASASLFVLSLMVIGNGDVGEATTNLTRTFHEHDEGEAVGPWGTLGAMACLSYLFLFALGGAGQPHVITKYLMARDVNSVHRTLLVIAPSYTLCLLLWFSVGFAMKYMVLTGDIPPLEDDDDAAPLFLLHYTPAWLAAIVFAGLFAASMSTADAFLNIGAGVFTRDFPRVFLGRKARNELRLARITTVLLAVGATTFGLWAKDQGDLIGILGAYGWGIFAAAFVPVVALGLNWKRATWQGASAAIGVGILVNVGLDLASKYPSSGEPLYKIPGAVSIGAVALLSSISTFILVSFLSPPQTGDKRLEAAMDA